MIFHIRTDTFAILQASDLETSLRGDLATMEVSSSNMSTELTELQQSCQSRKEELAATQNRLTSLQAELISAQSLVSPCIRPSVLFQQCHLRTASDANLRFACYAPRSSYALKFRILCQIISHVISYDTWMCYSVNPKTADRSQRFPDQTILHSVRAGLNSQAIWFYFYLPYCSCAIVFYLMLNCSWRSWNL